MEQAQKTSGSPSEEQKDGEGGGSRINLCRMLSTGPFINLPLSYKALRSVFLLVVDVALFALLYRLRVFFRVAVFARNTNFRSPS